MTSQKTNDDIFIELKDIKVFPNFDINNKKPIISCNNVKIYNGEITCVLGASGSGKTLISSLILGSLDEKVFSVSGIINIYVNGKLFQITKYKKYVDLCFKLRKKNFFGYITQIPNDVFSSLESVEIGQNIYTKDITVFEYFKQFLVTSNDVYDDEIYKSLFLKILRNFNIDIKKDLYKTLHSDLSMGMKQRLIIGIILSNKPQVVIGDEVTSSLDIKNTILVSNILSSYVKRNNCSFIFITHDRAIAKHISNKVYSIKNGNLELSVTNE